MSTLADELLECLATTLEYAVSKVPFYRACIPSPAGRGLSLSDFPVIDRAVMDANLGQFVAANRFPDYVITSEGTTGDPLAITFRVEEEYDAVHRFLTGYGPREGPPLDEIDSFTLDVYLNTNGYFRRHAPGWPTVSVALERRAHASLIERLLTDGLDLGSRVLPVGRVQSQAGVLRTLTGYFAATGFDPSAPPVESITGYGGHLSRVWRARIEEVWGKTVSSRYGLSEFTTGNATRCARCGALHYLTAWPEFLSLRDGTPVEHGDATLLLTNLLPFVTVQPRIRYCTGDLVSVAGRCEHTGLHAFHYRGRSVASVWRRDGPVDRVLVSETDMAEVLDQFAEVNVRRHTAEIQLWDSEAVPNPPFPVGSPRFRVAAGELAVRRPEIHVAVEVIFDPDQERRRAGALREAMTATMQDELGDPGLAIALDLVGPGDLR